MKPRQKPSGAWEARWFDPQAKRVKGKTFRTKKEALAYQAHILTEINKGTYVDPLLGKTTLATWWERFQQTQVHLSPGSRMRYQQVMDHHILPRLGHKALASIQRLDVEALVGELSLTLKPNTVGAIYRTFRRVLQTAVDSGLLVKNPASRISMPKVAQGEMRFLTAQEVEAVASEVPDRFRALVLTMAWTGLRWGEATGLTLENLDLLRGRIQVVQGFVQVKDQMILGLLKTPGSRRVITIPKSVREDVALHLSKYPAHKGLVFTTSQGLPLRNSNFRERVWLPALEAAGIKPPWPRLHDLRHTSVALAIAVGAHPKEIQARAGHTNFLITMDRYGHLFEATDEALAEKLNELREAK